MSLINEFTALKGIDKVTGQPVIAYARDELARQELAELDAIIRGDAKPTLSFGLTYSDDIYIGEIEVDE